MISLDYKLAIIVPYRDREEHLAQFVPHYRKLFPETEIYVVHQLGKEAFNKGMMMNIGFIYAEHRADAFNIADVDMLAVEGHVDYSFPRAATHLASAVSQFGYKMPYPVYFGGHVLVTAEQMRSVNGFYNGYPGYGVEDDCFYRSFVNKGLPVHRRYGKYESLPHKRAVEDDQLKELFDRNWERLKSGPRDFSNGITSCKYTIADVHQLEGYTQLDVTI
jgi:glycosyl transferase family 7 (putative galactosyltransferase)